STSRYLTSYGIEYNLQVFYPTLVKLFGKELDVMKERMDQDNAVKIAYAANYAGIANTWKNFIGQQRMLVRNKVEDKKKAIEQDFITWCGKDQARQKKYGKVLDNLHSDYADMKKGILTKEKALNLTESLYLLINNLVPDGLAVSVMVGGRDEKGKDLTNELSYLSLEALRRTKLVYPTVGVCWHKGTPEPLSMLAAELVSKGYSTPAFFGDETIQKGLRSYGLNRKQACNYINSTCVEITPVACSNVWVASPYFSLCKILLDEIDGQAAASKSQKNFESFLSSYYKRLGKEIKSAVEEQNKTREGRRQFGGKPLQSVFTKSCIDSGRDIDNGGADVNWVECSFVGIANLADSLHVIRNEVFSRKNIDLGRLKEILDSDFKGHENVRLRFLDGYEKYGNSCEEVDILIRKTADFIKKECSKHKVRPGKSHFVPGAFCWIMHERLGSQCGATPDGRRKGTPFADGGGPAQGREKKGPTSSILSATSWDHSFLIGGLAYNMKFSGELFNSPEAVKRLLALIITFLKRGGFETQINVVSREILEKAKKNPEQYRDLVVRIGGYTDYFTRLSPEMREEVMRSSRVSIRNIHE
ncbi:MAG: pyruvate formate lyase family protein, partial [Lentisphaerota bacterium]